MLDLDSFPVSCRGWKLPLVADVLVPYLLTISKAKGGNYSNSWAHPEPDVRAVNGVGPGTWTIQKSSTRTTASWIPALKLRVCPLQKLDSHQATAGSLITPWTTELAAHLPGSQRPSPRRNVEFLAHHASEKER